MTAQATLVTAGGASGLRAGLVAVASYGLLVLLCLALFTPGLFTIPPTDRDESRFAQASHQMLETGNFIDIRFQEQARHKKPIGIYWLQSLAAAPFGGDRAPIWAYRLPSVAGAILAVLLTAWAGTRLFGPVAGFLGGAALAGTLLLGVEARLAKTDAVLLACILAAQAILARAYLADVALRGGAAAPNGAPGGGLSRIEPWLFWAAIGIGILVKGPIILLVVGLTVLALVVVERRGRWLSRLRPLAGLGLVLAIVLPWLIAITLETRGAFFQESVGQDLLGKIFDGQEAHGAPPGYYLIAFWVSFWPWSLAAALALPWIWTHRREPAVRFCLAWIVPTWLVFELIATKLPHYVLPTYPAIALLMAAAALDGFGWRDRARPVWRFRAAAAGWAIPTAVLTLGLAALPVVLGEGIDWLAILGMLAALAVLAVAVRWLWRGRMRTALGAFALGAVLVYAVAFGRILPGLDTVWLSPRAAEAIAATRPCPDTVVAAAGFHEPSLVFLAGTATRLLDGAGAAQHLLADRCAMALIGPNDEAAFDAVLSDARAERVTVAAIDGFNYSLGRFMTLHLYILAHPNSPARPAPAT